MRIALSLLALFAIAVAAALLAGNNQGTITLFWPPYRVDLSLNLVLALTLGAFLVLHLALRALSLLFGMPREARRWRIQHRERAMFVAMLDSLAHLVAGRFIRARKSAEMVLLQEGVLHRGGEKAIYADRLRSMAHLLAAESAHSLQNREDRETHLRQAYEINKEETGPLLHLGEAALIRGDLVSAGRYFNDVLGSHAKSAEARFYVGYIALKGADTARAQTEFSRATSATAPPPAAGLPGEGDTKLGAAPLMQRTDRCDQLRALATAPRAASPAVEMFHHYRRLDSLLSVARSRFR